MPDDQALHASVEGALRRLERRRVMPLLRQVGMCGRIGSLVVQQVHTGHPARKLRERSRVGAVSEAARLPRFIGGVGAADDFVIAHDVLAALERPYFRQCELVAREHVLPYIERGFLLPEQETEGLNPVVQRECKHLEGFGLIDRFRLLHLERDVPYLEANAFPVIRQEELEDGPEGHGSVYIQGRGTTEHPHSR